MAKSKKQAINSAQRRRKNNPPSEEKYRRLVEISKMSIERRWSAEKIGENVRPFKSKSAVGEELREARRLGIVRTVVIPHAERGYVHDLAMKLRDHFSLGAVRLVPGLQLSNNRGKETNEDILANICEKAAAYLNEHLTKDAVLAVSGGRTVMRQVVRFLRPAARKEYTGLQVVPAMGFVNANTNSGDANLIAFDIARAYGVEPQWLPVPAIVDTAEQRELVHNLPIVKGVLELYEKATIFMTGLWVPNPDLVESGVLTQKQFDAIKTCNPVADINHWCFDATGNCINGLAGHPYQLTGLDIPALSEKVKQRTIESILVAGACFNHIAPIKAILKAGVANVLITDHITASLLLERRRQ